MPKGDVEERYQEAMHCTACFHEAGGLQLPLIDVPQPRWVGSAYHRSTPRVLIVMLNPGQGGTQEKGANSSLRDLLHSYRANASTFAAVMNYQRSHMQTWGKPQGRFLPFYVTALQLELDSIAFLNVALCATQESQYPREFLNRCFQNHTAAIAAFLQPDIVLLSGSAVHGFAKQFRELLPAADIVKMMHYAHRQGRATESAHHTLIREELSRAITRRPSSSQVEI